MASRLSIFVLVTLVVVLGFYVYRCPVGVTLGRMAGLYYGGCP